MQATPSAYSFLRRFIHKEAGIDLGSDKRYLIETRLRPIVEAETLDSLDALVDRLLDKRERALRMRVVEALTINETSFFRDLHPFKAMERSILPELIRGARAGRSLRVWSAACSTGQEPYSLAMILDMRFPELVDWKVEILATDLNHQVLERAQEGVFSELEVNRGLPRIYLSKYFRRVREGWKIDERLRRWIRFSPLNLAAPWPMLGGFDVILIRNVLIYFDADTRLDVLRRALGRLKPDGLIVLGAAESGRGVEMKRLEIDKTVVYKRA